MKAFTLVEMLVVMAIVAIVLALGVPAYQIIQARAKSSQCLSHLESLGSALNLYLGDHQMIMPTLAAARSSIDEELPVIDTVLAEYLESKNAFQCPADATLWKTTGTSYYWNNALNGQSAARLNLFGFIEDASRIPVILDKDSWHRYSQNKVNHLFADGHATQGLKMFVQ